MRRPPIALLIFGLGASIAAAVEPVPAVATKFLRLFEHLRAAQSMPPGALRNVHFQFSEEEINGYLQYSLRATPRPGLDSVHVKIFPYNYLSTFSVIDFDAVERWKPGTIPAVLRPGLRGRKSVWLDFRFRAEDGQTTFSLEKAYFQNLPLPAVFVEKFIQVVAARQPEHYDTSGPMKLPFGLRRAWTETHVIAGEN